MTKDISYKASLIAQLVKNLPAIQETLVQFLGWEVPLEKVKATHSSILAWRIPWTVCIVHGVAQSRTRLKRLSRLSIMICTHRYDIIQSASTALKNPRCSACSSPPSSSWQPLFTVSIVLLFSQNVIELESYSMKLFQIGFFHLVICMCVSSMSFHGLIAHSFLVMDNTHQPSFIDGPTSFPLTGNAFSITYEVSRGTEVCFWAPL